MEIELKPDIFKNLGKTEKYQYCMNAIKAVVEGESSLVANTGNTLAILKEVFNWWWIGFYFVNNDQLVLGPFQGPPACTRINFGKGVCGSAWEQQKTFIVPDVQQFQGHIACSAQTQSEIVVPIFTTQNGIVAVLDIDSEHLNYFTEDDQKYLEEICAYISKFF